MQLKNILKKLGLKKEKKKESYFSDTNDYTDNYVFTNNIKKGDKVVLVSNYETLLDASEGPLKPGDVGIVVENDNSYKPFKIKFNDKTWWYDENALKLYDGGS